MNKKEILNNIYDHLILDNYKDSSKEFMNSFDELSERENSLFNSLMKIVDEEGKKILFEYEATIYEKKCLEQRETFNEGFELHNKLI